MFLNIPPPPPPPLPFPSVVAQNNTEKSAWIIIDGKVYDVTNFAAMHPGGEGILLKLAGKDVTEEFYGLHKWEILAKVRFVRGEGEREK